MVKYLFYSLVIRYLFLVVGYLVMIDRYVIMFGYNGFEWVYNIFMFLKVLKIVFDYKIGCKFV